MVVGMPIRRIVSNACHQGSRRLLPSHRRSSHTRPHQSRPGLAHGDASAEQRTRTADPYELSGRGLHLVRSLTHRFGAAPHKRGGKRVWFELDSAA